MHSYLNLNWFKFYSIFCDLFDIIFPTLYVLNKYAFLVLAKYVA